MAHAPQAPRQLVLPIVREGTIVQFPLVALPAPGPDDDEIVRLHKRLAALLGEPIDLVPTDNRRNLLSWGREGGLLCIRIQHQFARAEDEMALIIAGHIRHGGLETAARIRACAEGFRLKPPRRRVTQISPPRGRHHDLQVHLREQNLAHFDGRLDARIGWARHTSPRERRTIRLGSWNAEERLIRIHPALDGADVPPNVVAFVVFHEMLHGAFHVEKSGERRIVHGPGFRAAERAHPHFKEAEGWIQAHVGRLLGRPL